MALDNIPVAVVSDDILSGINLGVRSARASSLMNPERLKIDIKQAKKLLPDDFSRFTACLLARYKLLTREDLLAVYLTVSNGCADGLLQSLQDEFGLAFNIQKACGGLSSKASAKNKLFKAVSNGAFRTMTPAAVSVRIQTQLYDEGLSPFIALTRRGAKAMTVLAKANGKKLSINDIQIPPHKSAVAIPQWLHERQVGDLIALTIVGASRAHGAVVDGFKTSCQLSDLLYEVPIKFPYGESVRYFKPDMGLDVTYLMVGNTAVHKRVLRAWVEHDTTSNAPAAIQNKVENYLLWVIHKKDSRPPYLLLTSSSDERRRNTIEPAVRAAIKTVVGSMFTDYTEMFGRIAFATHDDISKVGMWGSGTSGLWRKWDFTGECFDDKKRTLPVLGTVEKGITTSPKTHQPTDDIRTRAGSSASIGWRQEVA